MNRYLFNSFATTFIIAITSYNLHYSTVSGTVCSKLSSINSIYPLNRVPYDYEETCLFLNLNEWIVV